MTLKAYAGVIVLAGVMSLTGGCDSQQELMDHTNTAVPIIEERFTTRLDLALDIDSPTVWHGPDGEHWLLATAKESDCIVVYDAVTGEYITTFGTSGAAPGMFERPNGIVVADGILFVVERDNHRVQALRLPDGTPVGVFGAETLIRPYGIAIVPANGGWMLSITDNYETPEETTPPDADLGQRVKQYHVLIDGDVVDAEMVRTFGATSGPGVLHTVESIFADSDRELLLIADEHDEFKDIKVYTLDGDFTGTVFGGGIFKFEPEGIALYETANDGGYWFTTDQDHVENTFHLFDRVDFSHCGVFSGAFVQNTDGIALSQTALDGFPRGVFYAVHSDSGVCAFGLAEVLVMLGLAAE